MSVSPEEINAFLRSPLWRLMKSEMEEWLEEIRSRLEVELDKDEIRLLQGNAKGVRTAIMLPEELKLQLEADGLRRKEHDA